MPFTLPAALPGPFGKFRKSSGKRSFGKPDEGEVAVDADRGVAILNCVPLRYEEEGGRIG
jgi:hypothetical protein